MKSKYVNFDYTKLIYKYYLCDSTKNSSYEENRQRLEDELFKSAEKIISELNENTNPLRFRNSIQLLSCPYIDKLTSHYILIDLKTDTYMFIGPKNHPFQTEETKINDDKIKLYENIIKNDELYEIFFLKGNYKKQHKFITDFI
ncbi:hypothetical protein K9K83_04670 [Candidatus Woesearchaeota archaeon]|nr:hypothetical protein [Candidatus Woesearchaeota archaeon]